MRQAALLILILLGLAIPSTARACLGPQNEDTIFFADMPADTGPFDIAVKVKITGIGQPEDGTVVVNAVVTELVRGDMPKGMSIHLRTMPSSCGPDPQVGETGLVIGTHVPGKNTSWLTPRTRRKGDDWQMPDR